MVIGYTVYEPMNYTDADGNFTGFDTELATAVCAKLGVEPEFVEINWDTKVVELDAKSIDCIWNGMTLTEDIMANTATTKAYAKNAQVVVVKESTAYTSTADLIGKTVVAEAGSTGEQKLQGTIEDDETVEVSAKEYFANSTYIAVDSMAKALMEVKAGTADIALVEDEINELPHLLLLARRMMVTIKCNLTFSMTLNFIAIVLAITGILNPIVGALVHNAGSVLVIVNSAFLLKWKKHME